MKYLGRPVKSYKSLNSCKMVKTLCQDLLFHLDVPYHSEGGLKFASRFFYDFHSLTYVEDERIFVLDGIRELHKIYGNGEPLVKCRSLYTFINMSSADAVEDFVDALVENPWINNLDVFDHARVSSRASSAKSLVNSFCNQLEKAIIDYADGTILTPRGVWGLDFILCLRPSIKYNISPPAFGEFETVYLSEYQESFKEEISLCHS